MKIKKMILMSCFVALIIVGSFIKIPVPLVPFTLQFLFTSLAGLILGKKYGSYTVIIYLLMGLVGLPIFSVGGGLSYIFQPTFGYLLGFLFATYFTGLIANYRKNPTFLRVLVANFVGLIIVYVLGITYFYMLSNFYLNSYISFWNLLLYGFILAVPGDIIICFVSTIIFKRLNNRIGRLS